MARRCRTDSRAPGCQPRIRSPASYAQITEYTGKSREVTTPHPQVFESTGPSSKKLSNHQGASPTLLPNPITPPYPFHHQSILCHPAGTKRKQEVGYSYPPSNQICGYPPWCKATTLTPGVRFPSPTPLSQVATARMSDGEAELMARDAVEADTEMLPSVGMMDSDNFRENHLSSSSSSSLLSQSLEELEDDFNRHEVRRHRAMA
eukprot:749876-Hanusia_phi.AAC.4